MHSVPFVCLSLAQKVIGGFQLKGTNPAQSVRSRVGLGLGAPLLKFFYFFAGNGQYLMLLLTYYHCNGFS